MNLAAPLRSVSAQVEEFAPAKINLALHVTGRRDDGYHLLESLVVFAGVGDRVKVEAAAEDSFSVDGPFAGDVPVDESNLVIRAREALRAWVEGSKISSPHSKPRSVQPPSVLPDISPSRGEITPAAPPSPIAAVAEDEISTTTDGETLNFEEGGPATKLLISPLEGEMSGRTEGGWTERGTKGKAETHLHSVTIRLTKNLPIASGIGGGSSDAAAALKALNRLWNLNLTPDQFAEIARPLGADVPMCLHARPLVAKGIGEIIEPVEGFPALHMVLVNPGVPVSTPAVFSALKSRSNPPLPPLSDRLDFAALLGWLHKTRNDLEAPAIGMAPRIADGLEALRANDAALSGMSGSGATCFGLFETASAAERAATKIRRAEPGWFVAATQTTS